MTTRLVATEDDRKILLKLIQRTKIPFTATIERGKARTWKQNRLSRLWVNEISEQLGDRTSEEIRGYCKLTMGVPILRAENELFCTKYDEIVKPLPYEQKLAIMQEPLDFPITRLMKTDQQSRYLDAIHKFFTEQGVVLTMPPDRY